MDKKISLKTPFAEVFLSSDWSSSQAKYREEIRIELYKKTRNAEHLDLTKLPKSDNFFVSISHCKSLGGYALNLKEPIGFDVEQKERLKLSSIERISSDVERALFESEFVNYIWPIKEAAFKRFEGGIDVITDVTVKEAKEVSTKTFEGLLDVKGQTLQFLSGPVGLDCIFALVKSR
jgi:phosphopantetheinyl transferase (holo-ACP synthase)